jgi:hypothetical protein
VHAVITTLDGMVFGILVKDAFQNGTSTIHVLPRFRYSNIETIGAFQASKVPILHDYLSEVFKAKALCKIS